MFLRLCTAVAVFVALSLPAIADDKLKNQAAEAMKKSDVQDATIVETAHLVVASSLIETKAKALADSLEKTFNQAAKALKLDAGETKTQVTIFAFADLDNYKQFQRAVLRQRPEDEQVASYDVKRDDPYIAVSARRGDKSPNFETLAGNEICRALLARKSGNAKLTEWMKDGFAKSVYWRLNAGAAGADRAFVARIAPPVKKGAKGGMCPCDKAWTGTGKEKELVAASLMEYFTVGAGAEKFGNVVAGLIPTDAAATPTFMDALKAAEWMIDDLDKSWREWLGKGSPATAK
ncbi:MAG TPA: hypothetical protein VHR66_32505 [Gemmataceae bacterium]|jgi:ribosomal silencing factor RsfS|nr:hypothetical protein [Gemmataceae bacterium]